MYGLGDSALDTVAHAAYHLLGRRTFLTTGDDESRAWTFRAGAKAPECAGVIHTDLQRGLHPGRGDRLARAPRDRFVGEGPDSSASCASRARTTRCMTATCSRSASTSRRPRDALARCEVTTCWRRRKWRYTARAARAGLIGREDLEGVLVLRPCRQVHTFGMRFPIDVAFCDRYGFVLHTVTMPPRRVFAARVAFVLRDRGTRRERSSVGSSSSATSSK